MTNTFIDEIRSTVIHGMDRDAKEEGKDLAFTMILPFSATEQDIDELESIGVEIFKPFYKEVCAVVVPKYFVAGIVVTC